MGKWWRLGKFGLIGATVCVCAIASATTVKKTAGPSRTTAHAGAPDAGTWLNVHVTAATKFYPWQEARYKVTGCVRFSFTLGPDGYPLVESILRSWPPAIFNAAALAAAPGFRFGVTDNRGDSLSADRLRETKLAIAMIYSMPGGEPGRAELSYRCGELARSVLIVAASRAAAGQKIMVRPLPDADTAAPAAAAPTAPGSQPAPELAAMLPSDLVTMPVPPGKTLRDGWVEVSFCVGADGRATHATVTRSSRHGLYNQAALAALATWTFVPRVVLGKAVETCRLSYSIPVVARGELERGPVALQPGPTVVNPGALDNARPLFRLHRGAVTLRFCVDPDGSLDDVGIVEPGSNRAFAAAAIAVLYSWQFLPREVNDKPVRACNGQQTLHFLAGYDMLNHHLIQVSW